MKSISVKFLIALCGYGSFFTVLTAGYEDYRKQQMIHDLEVIKHNFEAGYAPMVWKKEQLSFDLGNAFERAKGQILTTPNISTKQFHRIVRQFVNATRDYHVDAVFYSTEAASLPFSIRGAEGRYFIDWIDTLRLSSSYFNIQTGDELLTFDERPIADVINELTSEMGKKSNEKTDRRMAEIKLTQRIGAAGDVVPKGAIMLSTRSLATGKIERFQLHWSYIPEHISNPFDFLESLSFLPSLFLESKEESKIEIPQVLMANPVHQAYAAISADRTGGMGAQKSFVPPLGEVLWSTEEEAKTEENQPSNYHAYAYRHPTGAVIGYIRIPHYHESRSFAEEFGEIINHLEEKTDALVIDQLHNFGGFVDYMYELASMLAIEPLKAPYHRIKITQKEVMRAYQTVELINLMEMLLVKKEADKADNKKKNSGNDNKNESEDKQKDSNDKPNDSDEKKQSDEKNEEKKQEEDFNYQELMFLKSYHELILAEWNRGETLTRPTHILGTDRINPHPKYRYTKPIVILIDEMDFSGGDFMPAILQDNRRALLFGSKTAGAGGFITSFQFPNSNGIALCSYTASVAERPNMQKIENVGITPDVEYQITASDIQNGYQGYLKAVNEAVQHLLAK